MLYPGNNKKKKTVTSINESTLIEKFKYLGPPAWIEDPEELMNKLQLPRQFRMPFLFQNFIRQREIDDSWRHLDTFWDSKEKLPFDEVAAIYAKAGIKFKFI